MMISIISILALKKSYIYCNSENTNVLKTNDGGLHIHLSANSYGGGRSVYLAGLPYSHQNSRLLLRTLFWAAGQESNFYKWFSSNKDTDCAWYPDLKNCVVVNNVNTNVKNNII